LNEHVASISSVEEQAKQETIVKAGVKKSLCFPPVCSSKRRLNLNGLRDILPEKTELCRERLFF
jgi:hypothetical protein